MDPIHGTLHFADKHWIFRTDPEVSRRLKRLFTGARGQFNEIKIPHTKDTAADVLWILDRYPHSVNPDHLRLLKTVVASHREAARQVRVLLTAEELPQPANIATPLRQYQVQAVELAKLKEAYLLGDDMGLGKTASAVGLMANADARPALVVCATHVQQQWADQIRKFCPSLRCHIIKQRDAYPLPVHDVTIITYSKLDAWADRRRWNTVIYDEVQELRAGQETKKGKAAAHLSTTSRYRLGLSATPVYNYAGEVWNVMQALVPDALGTYGEFITEWAGGDYKGRVKDAEALGAFLRSQQLYLRRTRRDVGRELPPILKITQTIASDGQKFDHHFRNKSLHLARVVLEGAFTERGQAARELDTMLRQATGIAKAPFVAEFVKELAENGQKIVLAGWHREVFQVWRTIFREAGIHSVMYTGSENPGQKIAAVDQFVKGRAQVFIMSLRSGAGLDGLQEVCDTVVFGELDWSPKVMDQLTGRLHRDGQESNVTAFYLLSDEGSDPIVAGILGIKGAQSTAITDPDLLQPDGAAISSGVPETRVAELARKWLARLQ